MKYTFIQTARLNDMDPLAWLADVLARINGHTVRRPDQPISALREYGAD